MTRAAIVWSIITTLISVTALSFSGLQWYEAHEQLVFSMKPSVNLVNNLDDYDPPIGITIENEGPGPAKIKSIKYFVDRKPFKDEQAALDAAKLTEGTIQIFELDEGDTLGVGTKLWLLSARRPRGKGATATSAKENGC